MAPTKKNTKTEQTVENNTPATQPVVVAQKTNKSTSKKEATPAVVETPVVDKKTSSKKQKVETPTPVPTETKPTETAQNETNEEPKTRRKVTVESVEADFQSLKTSIEETIAKITAKDDQPAPSTDDSSAPKKKKKKQTGVGSKALKSWLKSLRQLHLDSTKLFGRKKKQNKEQKSTDEPTGFQTPIHISTELAKYLGWDASKEYIRTEVTKALCKKIRDDGCQGHPTKLNKKGEVDKSYINPNKAISNLLKLSSSEPFTFFQLQTYISENNHYVKIDKEKSN